MFGQAKTCEQTVKGRFQGSSQWTEGVCSLVKYMGYGVPVREGESINTSLRQHLVSWFLLSFLTAIPPQCQPWKMKSLTTALCALLGQSTVTLGLQGYTNESEVPLYGLSPPVYPSRKLLSQAYITIQPKKEAEH